MNEQKRFPIPQRNTLLIIDDNKETLNIIKMYLENTCTSIKVSASLADAKKILLKFRPKVILVDFHLTDGNALELLDHLQRKNELPEFIVFTGDINQLHRLESIAGVSDVILKPIELKELKMIIEKHFYLSTQ